MDWKPKYVQVVETLRTMISSGGWQDVLPGYRVLGEQLGVSRPTLEKALAELTAEGLLAESESGKARRILVAPPPVSAHVETRTLLILSPYSYHELDWDLQAELEIVTSQGHAEGWRIAYDHFAFLHFKNPASYLERIVRNHRPERVVLLTPTQEVAEWFLSRGIPFFCFGGALADIAPRIDGAGSTMNLMAHIGLRHLQEQGHRKILVPISSLFENNRPRLLEIAATEWGCDLGARMIERLHPVHRFTEPDVMNSQWNIWIRETEPSAVIVANSRELLSLIGYCHMAGLQIPNDLSIVSLSWEPILQWMNPVVTAVALPVEACGQWALAWLRAPIPLPKGMRIFDCTLSKGDSVAAPSCHE